MAAAVAAALSPRFRLYHCAFARSFRCLWALTELGLDGACELITMPFPPRVLHREFLKVNPLGTVPYFEDLTTATCREGGAAAGGGGGIGSVVVGKPASMTESCAVPLYLVTKYRPDSTLGVAPDHPDYAAYLNWIAHADATLTFPQTVVLRYTVQEPGVADAAARGYARWYFARLRMLNAALSDGRQFLVADRFTVADICVALALHVGTSLFLDGKALSDAYNPPTAAYLARMQARPGWAKAVALQGASAARFQAEHGGGGASRL